MNVQAVYLAPEGLDDVLRAEVGNHLLEHRDRLILASAHSPTYFAQNCWLEPQLHKFDSISQAASILRGIQRNWSLVSTGHHRRAKLIEEQLPPIKAKRLDPFSAVPGAPIGGWTLWDEKTLLYSARTTSPFPNGVVEFNEDKVRPPSRAYLKLWEFFLLKQKWPASGETVIDLGSSPGGWTWVLDQLGCQVTSVDKAPLAENLELKHTSFLSESAFALAPYHVDWLFSDIICYPDRLFALVERWRGFAKNFVCTIKFQGETDFLMLRKFAELPGAEIRHLYHNKHELMLSVLMDT